MALHRLRSRTRGAAAVEWIIVVMFIAIVGLKVVYEFGRIARCKMAAGDHASECTSSSNTQLKPADDGCIGLVCKQTN